MNKEIIQKAVEEARSESSNLVIWDRRDTFTVEPEEMPELEVNDDHLRVKMQDGKATVYVEFDSIFKLVVERERTSRAGIRAGFGAARS
jgi:hypothetical protein